jgi:hypothetical protein
MPIVSRKTAMRIAALLFFPSVRLAKVADLAYSEIHKLRANDRQAGHSEEDAA